LVEFKATDMDMCYIWSPLRGVFIVSHV